MKTNVLRIHTPEGVVFSQLLASPVVRCAAWLIDSMAIGALMMVPGFLVTILRLVSADIAEALYAIAYFVLSIGYGMGCEWLWRGQTLGKKLFRLRVVDAEGLRLRFNQIVIRNLIRSVDALPLFYLVGGITCWLNPKGQRLGDIAANTVVVRASRVAEPNLDQLLASKFNSLRLHPHLEARLRQQVSPAEAAVALQALLRRDDFDPQARIELFAELARHFRRKVEFPREDIEGLSDEQYVRNAVDVLYRTQKGQRMAAIAA